MRCPQATLDREFSTAGGLMTYRASDTDAYRRGAAYVGRILKGAQPDDLPVELRANYELIINLATAKALKLDIRANLLALARRGDRVGELLRCNDVRSWPYPEVRADAKRVRLLG
jgi:ABC-type uncharacterized transport system substrate-binding protein